MMSNDQEIVTAGRKQKIKRLSKRMYQRRKGQASQPHSSQVFQFHLLLS